MAPIYDEPVPESSPWVAVGAEYRDNWIPVRTFIMDKDDLILEQARVELRLERERNAAL